MPTISECQLFIQEILHVVNDLIEISHVSRMALDREFEDENQLPDLSQSESASDSDSLDSSSSSSSTDSTFLEGHHYMWHVQVLFFFPTEVTDKYLL